MRGRSAIGSPWVGAMIRTSSSSSSSCSRAMYGSRSSESRPVQGELGEERRHLRQVQRRRLLGGLPAVAVLVVVAVREPVAREQHAAALVEQPDRRAQVVDDRLEDAQPRAAEVDRVAGTQLPEAVRQRREDEMQVAEVPGQRSPPGGAPGGARRRRRAGSPDACRRRDAAAARPPRGCPRAAPR